MNPEPQDSNIEDLLQAMNSRPATLDLAARSTLVNRTHRVVRARAQSNSDRRRRLRSLWIPLVTSAALLVMISTAIWTALDEYELAPTGIPDASDQMLVLLLWFFPISAALMAMIWFRRSQTHAGNETMR